MKQLNINALKCTAAPSIWFMAWIVKVSQGGSH